MIPIKDMLDIICTEAFENSEPSLAQQKRNQEASLPVLRYDLELIRREDGTIEWIE